MALPASDNYLSDNEDLKWQFQNGVEWDEIIKLTELDFSHEDAPDDVPQAIELYTDILEEVGRFVANELAPRVEEIDRVGTKLVDGEVQLAPGTEAVMEGFKEMGLMSANLPRELGGMNCPLALYFTMGEVIARGDCGIMTHVSFYGGIALSLLSWSSHEGSLEMTDGKISKFRFQEVVESIAAGESWGAMVLTEPDAGSDLGNLKCRATKSEDGSWRLDGEKIFITSGHAQHQIVLARTSEGGLDALSLFYVPRVIERDGERVENVKITKVEKKLGHNSSATCSLLYEGSEGELIGKEGEGFKLMLTLMNNARIAVSFEGIGICEAALRMAQHYASQRSSMGRLLKDHELLADRLQKMDTELRGMRALAFSAMNATEISNKLRLKLKYQPPVDEEQRAALERRMKKLERQAREVTPLLKYITAEKACEFARWNMQIHGGMGYITETGADRLLRDALVLPVYEGTSQIQALMALKDHLGAVMKDPVRFMQKQVRARVRARTARGVERLYHQAETQVYQALSSIIGRIFGSKLKAEWSEQLGQGPIAGRLDYLRSRFLRSWDPREDFAHGLVHAERLAEMLCDLAIARVLLRQGRAHPERMIYAERFIRRMMPRLAAKSMEIRDITDLEELRAPQGVEEVLS